MSDSMPTLPILIAEDNFISRELIVQQLNLLGRSSVACEDGSEALRAWRTGRFAMLLTDLQMPVLDGFALVAAIRGEEVGARLPIVAFTASGVVGDVGRYAAAGFDATLPKPASLDALRQTIATWAAPLPTPP
jgi:CheY-like chemotaxis protein